MERLLHLVDFAYKNGYQTSLKMSPFEALYGRKCKTPVSWDNAEDRAVVGPDLLKKMEQMLKIKQNLRLPKVGRKAMLIREELTGNLKWVTMYS